MSYDDEFDEPPPSRRGDLRVPHFVSRSETDYFNEVELMSEECCRENFWFYRDRTGLPRGPMTIETVKKCYINGVVDQHTLFWGNGLGDWVPLRNLRGMGDCLNDPKTRFLKFIVNRFVYPVAERRRNRDRLHAEGKAKSPTMTKEQVAEWRRRREERLVAGEESTMLSLSLATGRRERAARKMAKAVEKAWRGLAGGEEPKTVESA